MSTNIKKQIAKNTAYLYASSIVSLFVGLYTSRILLQTLGIEDFGLYGAVGSIVSMLGFLNIAMGSASSRYLTYELVKGSLESQRRVFSTVFIVHFFLGLAVFLLAETVGLWYVCSKLEIPDGRFTAALWVYQSSIVISFINIIQVPYNALVTSHERMSFSSLWSIVNTLLRFALIFSLYWITFDRLIYYALAITATTLLTFLGYIVYCKFHFEECHLVMASNKKLFSGILSFAGYSAFSSSSSIIRTQGNTLFINKFFGVAMNASASIANGVVSYSSEFSQNVINAFRPQIIKTYAQNDFLHMQEDIVLCMKYCVAIFCLIAMPMCVEINYILKIWLGTIPPYSGVLCQIGLVGSLFGLVTMIMTIAIQATSKVKVNSLIVSALSILSLLVTFFFLQAGFGIASVFIIYTFTQLVILVTTMINMKILISRLRLTSISLTLVKVVSIALASVIIPILITFMLNSSFMRFLLTSSFSWIIFIFLFGFTMLNAAERMAISNQIHRIVQ